MWKNGVAVVALAGLFCGSAYAQPCVQVRGKIVNNIIPTQAGFFTMGVASVVYAGNIKLKCALLGQPLPPNSQDPAIVAFVHTISCDDAIDYPQLGPVHSRLQFNSVGTQNADFSFTETSTPIPGTGTGLFQGVTNEGSLAITGQIYQTGAIDMTLSGQACYPQ
jgi:hypothetical protein